MRIAVIPFALALLILPFACRAPSSAAERVAGPIEADVVRIIDGDTFVAEARVWPGQRITVGVRIRGVDAPELHSRCAAEKKAARRSRTILEGLVRRGPVRISNVAGGKYYGRVLADVTTADGRGVADALLGEAAARRYEGGARKRYCE